MKVHHTGFLLNNRYTNSTVPNQKSQNRDTDRFELQTKTIQKPTPSFKGLFDIILPYGKINKKLKYIESIKDKENLDFYLALYQEHPQIKLFDNINNAKFAQQLLE